MPREVAVARDPRWIVGVDIGGTNLVVGMVPFVGGPPEGVIKRPTESERGPTFVVGRVISMIRESMAAVGTREDGPDVAGIGIGSPGPLDRSTGTVLNTPNLGWRNFPLRDLVTNEIPLTATLDNDANCATYGEWWLGAGQKVERLIGLTLGTGIGGGIVIGGEVYHGASDAAGEVGHMSIDFTGRRCACGSYGCIEAYASGPNIAARAVEGIEAGAESLLVDLVEGDLTRITAATVSEAVVAGDRYADQVMVETAKILGAAAANLINLFNPEVIVVAGGVTRAGDHLFEPLRREVRRRAFRSAVDACRIVPAQLPETAGLIGAAGVFKRVTFGHV